MGARVFPASFEEAAATLRDAAAARQSIRVIGGATKPWGRAAADPDLEIGTAELDRIVEHNEGDLTAVLEAGVPLAQAQQQFASTGQMLALDPHLGPGQNATIGGILATADAGPLRHRYGAPRDLVLGMTVALSDGAIARSGGKVIKNVAGYDVAKLFCGSLGTLGMILSVNLRLHPRPTDTRTVLGVSADPDVVGAAARALSAAPLELEALDVAWRTGRGGILAQAGGVQSVRRSQRVASLMREAGLESVDVVEADAELWARQRAGQRSAKGTLLRVAARPSSLPLVLRAADAASATLVGRAALGHTFLDLDPDAVGVALQALPADARAVVLDRPASAADPIDPWGRAPEPALLDLMARVKARFDPARICNPGVFVGGI